MSRSREYPHYKRIIDGIIIGGVGVGILTLSGCANAQEVAPTPSVTTEAPTTTTTPSIVTSTEWPPKSGAACDADQLPAFEAQPGNTGYYVFELRSGCTDYGVKLYEGPQLKGSPVDKIQPETPFAVSCVSHNGDETIAKIDATKIHPAHGYAVLGAAAAQFASQIPGGKPDCPMY